ncbi:Nn.00g007650.m01.CDS01 [Neocucurbitaria sp. VM-36]
MAHGSVDLAWSGRQQERITIAFLVLAWFFILLRTWTRTYIISSFGWDDSTMILAGMIFTVYCSGQLYIEANGGGTHVSSIAQLQSLTKWVVVSEASYIMAMMVLKISLGIFFARIIIKRWQFLLIYITVGVNIFSSAAAFFYCLFRCGPNLDDYVVQQLRNKCTSKPLDRFMAYQQAAFTTLTDAVFFALPIFVLWNANMSRKSKFSVGFILCLAALGCICSMIRFRYVDGLTQVDDFFWNAVNVAIWSTIEAGASIIAGCLATLRPFLKRILTKTRVSTGLSGCVKQISKSMRSSERSSGGSHGSSIPHSVTATSTMKSTFESTRRGTAGTGTEEPDFAEYLAPPGEEVIALSSTMGRGRGSTDRIIARDKDAILDFPWPMKPDNCRNQDGRRRQTVHTNWTLRRGVARGGRTIERPISAPVVPAAYERDGDSAT